jgi:hypothetical protein
MGGKFNNKGTKERRILFYNGKRLNIRPHSGLLNSPEEEFGALIP